MKTERVKAFKRLKDKIETTELKKEFADKKEILIKLAAVCTGMDETLTIEGEDESKETTEK